MVSYLYMDRLRLLNLPTLEKPRLWADISLCFKLRRGLLNCTSTFSLLPSTYSRTRGHNFKLRTGKIRCETTKNSFCNRVVRSWNSLPVDNVNSSYVSRFDSAICKLNLNQPTPQSHLQIISFFLYVHKRMYFISIFELRELSLVFCCH